MRLSIVSQVVGRILRLYGAMFLAPVLVALYYGERDDVGGFMLGGLLATVAGQIMVNASRESAEDLRRIEALAVVSSTWLLVAILGAIPYVWAGLGSVDAFFESMSGFTTTGATILSDFDRFGRGIMFWRSLTQWLGGMGVITLFVAVLPRIAVGVSALFFAEAPGPTDEKLTPHIRETAAYLWRFYAGLTLAAMILLTAAGMPGYDALCHAMTTLAAGGFSPNGQSIMGYQSAAVEWIICVFMFLAGANFALQYRVLLGRPRRLLDDDEFRGVRHDYRAGGELSHADALDLESGGRVRAGGNLSDPVDTDDDGVRKRRFRGVERSSEGRAVGSDVYRRLRGIGGRRPQGAAARARRPLHNDGAATHPSSARCVASQAAR